MELSTGPVFRVTLSPGEDGYVVAECLNLPGCMSQGRTEQETLQNITDAIKACVSVILEDALASLGAAPVEAETQHLRVFRPQIELISTAA